MKLKKWENKIKRKDLKQESNRYIFNFQQFETIRSFVDSIYTGKISIYESKMDQTNLSCNICIF